MANKIEASIKKFLSKNERAAGRMRKKKVVEAVSDTAGTKSESQLIEDEIRRRATFAGKKPAFSKATSDTTGSDEDVATRMYLQHKRAQAAAGVKKKKKKR